VVVLGAEQPVVASVRIVDAVAGTAAGRSRTTARVVRADVVVVAVIMAVASDRDGNGWAEGFGDIRRQYTLRHNWALRLRLAVLTETREKRDLTGPAAFRLELDCSDLQPGSGGTTVWASHVNPPKRKKPSVAVVPWYLPGGTRLVQIVTTG